MIHDLSPHETKLVLRALHKSINALAKNPKNHDLMLDYKKLYTKIGGEYVKVGTGVLRSNDKNGREY